MIDKFEKTQPAGCDTKYLVTGYSQGAMAARALADMNDDVIGAVDFGDPYQKPNAAGIEGDVDGEGIVRSFLTGDGKKTVDAFYSSVDHQTTICHDNDPICSYSWLWGLGGLIANIEPHTTYMTVGTEATRKGRELANLAAAQWPKGTTPTPAPRKAMDVMFVIDTTGSMGGYIDEARRTARTAAAAVFGAARNGRVGLVEFRDYGDDFIARTVVPLTDDADQFYNGLDGLYPSGGGDWEEAVVSGVFEAVRADWNTSAARSVIVIGDAPGHDPEVGTGYTFTQMTQVLTGAGIVPDLSVPMLRRGAPDESRDQVPGYRPADEAEDAGRALPADEFDASSRTLAAAAAAAPPAGTISLYGISSVNELSAQLGPVADATGGQLLPTDSSDGLGALILDAIDDASAAPEASLRYSGVTATGLPVAFSAGDSVVAELPATYDFDLDGDGTFEVSGSEVAAEHTYSTAGTYQASVRVTDARGRAATATVTFDIRPFDETVVQLPDASNPSTLLERVTLSGSPMPMSAPATLTVADTLEPGERVGARLVAAGAPDPWTAPPVAAFDVPANGAVASAALPSGVAPGAYDLLVFTDRARHASVPLTVQAAVAPADPSPSPSPSATGPLTPSGGGSGPAAAAVSARPLPATGGSADWVPGALLAVAGTLSAGLVLVLRARRHPKRG